MYHPSETNMSLPKMDQKARARQAMLDAGFQPDFSPDVARELQALKQTSPPQPGPAVRDLLSLLWSSIDNDSSRVLDQVDYAEKLDDGLTLLMVGIAAVDAPVLD